MPEPEIARLAAIKTRSYKGDGYRQQAPNYEPLSGEGARRRGARFDPPDSFPVLYLCSTRACAVAEFMRAGDRLAIGHEGLLPRHLFRYEIDLDGVLDLTDSETREELGIDLIDLLAEDLSVPQLLEEAANSLGLKAIRCPSATGSDDVLAVLLQNLGSGVVAPHRLEIWTTLHDVEG